jgi:hypothetical protein
MSDDDLSIEHLKALISTLPEWSMKQPWTKAQAAAWRLCWFGKTPEQDAADREEWQIRRAEELAAGFDRYSPREQEPFIDWPNGQGE